MAHQAFNLIEPLKESGSGAHELRYFFNMKYKIQIKRHCEVALQAKPKQSKTEIASSASGLFAMSVLLGSLVLFQGCKASYPEEKVASAIKEICLKEYKIEDVEVKFAGKTVGVFLPLRKLFAMDVRQELLSGNIANLESLFEPEPEAMEQLENVLFTISRVLLSSDREIDFYVLQATDIESTGLQLVLMGYVPDVRRVRLWDISRTEYRKRVLHELKFNRSVLWEKPVRGLFALTSEGRLDLKSAEQFFTKPITPETASPLLYDFLVHAKDKPDLKIDLVDIRSRAYKNNQSLVHLKLIENFEPAPGNFPAEFLYPSGSTLEYIFIVEPSDKQFKIVQVIPFYYMDETRTLKKVPLPPELDLDRNLDTWPERFNLEEITVGDFLARQLNRRVQALLLSDERIHHTIRHAQVNFAFRTEPANTGKRSPHFSLYFDFITKGMPKNRTLEEVISDEDILYLMDMILREFAVLARSYQFEDYEYLELVWEPAGSGAILRIEPSRLGLFRERKMDVSTLLGNKPPVQF